MDNFNQLLSELNDSIEKFNNNKYIVRSHNWESSPGTLWIDVGDKGEKIEQFLLDYIKINTKDETYNIMNNKLNIVYKKFKTE
jgi:hypothetical protein